MKIIKETSMFNSPVREYKSNPPWYSGHIELLINQRPGYIGVDYRVKVEDGYIQELTMSSNGDLVANFNGEWIKKPSSIYSNFINPLISKYGVTVDYKRDTIKESVSFEKIKSSSGKTYSVRVDDVNNTISITKYSPYDLQEYHWAELNEENDTWDIYDGNTGKLIEVLDVEDVSSWVALANILQKLDERTGYTRKTDRT